MSSSTPETTEVAKPSNSNFLGPDYPYQDMIKSPSEMNVTTKGTISGLGDNIKALSNYAQLLLYGTGSASKSSNRGRPLGNKFFYYTGGSCIPTNKLATVTAANGTAADETPTVDRYIYVNNVPDGRIGIGKFSITSDFKGLIPGITSDLLGFTHFSIMNAFSGDTTPDCQLVNLETIDDKNNTMRESHYIALADIKNMRDCSCDNNNQNCKCGFTNMTFNSFANSLTISPVKLSDNIIDQFFFLSICIIAIYILYRIHLHP